MRRSPSPELTGGSIRLLNVLDELVFTTGFETGATYMRNVLPALRQHSERILAAGRDASPPPRWRSTR